MNKKLISSLMALALMLGTTSTAFASTTTVEDSKTQAEVSGDGSVTPAIIDVEIPTSFGFSIDPFNVDKGGKIVSTALQVENKSNVPVEIKMSEISGTASGELNLVSTPAEVTAEGEGKDAFLWLGQVAVTVDKEGKITAVKPEAAYSDAKNAGQVIKEAPKEEETRTEKTEVSMGNLLEATYDDSGYASTNAKGKMYLGIMGDVRTVDGWSSEDGVEVVAKFTVTPKVVGSIK